MIKPCIICNKQLDSAIPEDSSLSGTNQPYKGIAFMSYGHYGSTIFDPRPNSKYFLEVIICEDCIKSRLDKVLLGSCYVAQKVEYEPFTLEMDL